MTNNLRAIPSVERLLKLLGPQVLPRPLVVSTIRSHLEAVRSREIIPDEDTLLGELRNKLQLLRSCRLQPVVNGTGIIIHTNLGRSPLAPATVRALAEVAGQYTNLEMDLDTGERGGRASYLEKILALLCEAEAATVVNNCAAALVLILRQFASKKPEVIVSRGELVQIGGGFRIPEILESAGTVLREVGTTNKTGPEDYRRAISGRTGLILKVHQSNFRMAGFVEAATVTELKLIAQEGSVPLAVDLGSGALFRTDLITGLEREPRPAEMIREGADLVCFSGDKLFGGPQAGVIAGQARLIEMVKKDPLFRAFRCDKLILCALQNTVELSLNTPELPPVATIQLLSRPTAELRARGERILRELTGAAGNLSLVETRAEPGGGTLPEATLDSIAVEIVPKKKKVNEFARELRLGVPPIIGYISNGTYRVDLRTVLPDQDNALTAALKVALEVRSRLPSPL